MSNLPRKTAALVAAAAGLLLAAAEPASAVTRSAEVTDPSGDFYEHTSPYSGGDITKARVSYDTVTGKITLTSTHNTLPTTKGDGLTVYRSDEFTTVDANGKTRQFLAYTLMSQGRLSVYQTWDSANPATKCRVSATYSAATGVTTTSVPKSCLAGAVKVVGFVMGTDSFKDVNGTLLSTRDMVSGGVDVAL